MPAPIYCTRLPVRQSISPQNRFWYSDPSVMPSSDTMLAAQPSGVAAANMVRSCSTIATPTRPSASPNHCSRVTVSPMKRLAIVEVRIGCSPGISAEMPAGTPWLMAVKTPPR